MQKLLVLFTLLTSMQLHAIGCFAKKDTPKDPPPVQKEALEETLEEALAVTPDVMLINATPFTFLSSALTGDLPLFVTYSPDGKFAAVTNFDSNNISVYRVDQHTGAFTEIEGSPFQAGSGTVGISYSPCGRYATVTNQIGQSIFVYRVDCTTGALSLIQSLHAPFDPEINQPVYVVYSPDGRFVAVPNAGGPNANIATYLVHPTTGKLSLIDASNTFDSQRPVIVKFSPDGRFLAATFQNGNFGATFTVDPVTGVLSNQMNFTTNNGPTGIAYSPNGIFAAVSNQFSNTITTYTVNQTSGTFSLTDTIPFPPQSGPIIIEYSPDGTLAAATLIGAGQIVFFCVDQTTGLFTQITPPIINLNAPVGIAFHPCKDFAAVVESGGNRVDIYGVDTSACQ